MALITGASGGLGTAVTQQFLEAGHHVCAVALDWPRPVPQTDSCMTLQADLRDPTAAESAVRAAVERWGGVNFLVHLVGAYRSGMRLEDTTDEFWDEMLDVNLRTAVSVMRAVIPSMRKQRRGRITVVGATTALQPVVTWSAFCSSVAALCEVLRVAAAELRDEGITVNAILPSTIATTFVRVWRGRGTQVGGSAVHRLADALALLRRRARCDLRVDPVHRPSVPSLLPLARCHRLRAVISGKTDSTSFLVLRFGDYPSRGAGGKYWPTKATVERTISDQLRPGRSSTGASPPSISRERRGTLRPVATRGACRESLAG